jgi:hypothetical protein
MNARFIRKLLVALVIIAPVFSNTDCKKQDKCGCDGDVLFTLDKAQVTIYINSTGNSITFAPVGNPYETYNFCNPNEMLPKLADVKSGDMVLVSGDAYWECNFLMQSSNSSYQSYYKVYMIKVTDVGSDLYGKK